MLSTEALMEIANKHNTLKEGVKGRGTEIATIAIHGAEVAAGAFACGYANGRWSKPGTGVATIGNVPLDLGVGAIGLLASALDAFGPMNLHVAHIGLGAAAVYFARVGAQKGEAARALTHQATAPRLPAAAPAQAVGAAGAPARARPHAATVTVPPAAAQPQAQVVDMFAWAKR